MVGYSNFANICYINNKDIMQIEWCFERCFLPLPIPEKEFVTWTEPMFGQVTAEGGCWAGVLIGPQLVLTSAGVLLEGDDLMPAAVFHTRRSTASVVRAWRVG